MDYTALKKLTATMSLSAFDGHIVALAGSGFFKIAFAPLLAFTLIVGPLALMMAMNLQGELKERMLTALFAGLIATGAITLVALLGSKLEGILNFSVFKIAGASAVLVISFMLFGVKIPERVPLMLMLGGLILSFLIPK